MPCWHFFCLIFSLRTISRNSRLKIYRQLCFKICLLGGHNNALEYRSIHCYGFCYYRIAMFYNLHHAVVLVSESFNYPTGLLNGQSGGIGFSGPWQSTSQFSVTPGSLAVPNYAGTGNSMQFSSSYYTSLDAGRNLTTTYGASNSDLWASFLIRVDYLNAYAGLNFATSGQALGGLFVGILGGPNGMWPPSSTWGMDTAGGTGRVLSNVPVVYGQTNLLVVHMTTVASGEDRFDLYVNPSQNLPAYPDATKTISNWSFNKLSCGTNNGTGQFDEIRLGTTYADVRPVPEPSCILLMAIGGVLLLLRRLSPFSSRN